MSHRVNFAAVMPFLMLMVLVALCTSTAHANPTLNLWVSDPSNPARVLSSVSCILGTDWKTEAMLDSICQMGAKNVLDGKYYSNFGSPMISRTGEFQTWSVYLATFSGYQSNDIYLHWFLQDCNGTEGKIEWRIGVYKTTSFWPQYANVAASTKDAGCLTLPAYYSNKMEGEWYLGVVADNISKPVPEPGNIVAMLSGLIGFGGLILRRRK